MRSAFAKCEVFRKTDSVKVEWDTKEDAFQTLKRGLSEEQVLMGPDY